MAFGAIVETTPMRVMRSDDDEKVPCRNVFCAHRRFSSDRYARRRMSVGEILGFKIRTIDPNQIWTVIVNLSQSQSDDLIRVPSRHGALDHREKVEMGRQRFDSKNDSR
jgi:hypothetical protein